MVLKIFMTFYDKTRIADRIMELCLQRGLGKTICPSEVARSLAIDENDWRNMMTDVRSVAAELAEQGKIVVTQKGQPVDVTTAKGPVRFSLVNK